MNFIVITSNYCDYLRWIFSRYNKKNSHRVKVCERRFSFGHFNHGYAQRPDICLYQAKSPSDGMLIIQLGRQRKILLAEHACLRGKRICRQMTSESSKWNSNNSTRLVEKDIAG